MVAAAWLLALLLVLVPPARAERARVVLVDVPAELEHSTRVHLAPWNLRVISAAAPRPWLRGRAVQCARGLAAQHRADAVVWLASSPGGHVLQLYDAHQRRLISHRLVIGPPFDASGAASVALSLKTLLRHTLVAPEDQRFPYDPGSDEVERRETRLSECFPDDDTVNPPPGPEPSFNLEARIQMRSTRLVDRERGPRFGIGLAWWPRALGHRYGLAVHLEGGPEPPVKTEEFRTHFLDTALSVALRRRIQVRGRIYAVADGGVSLHFTRLDGVFVAGPGRIRQHKTNPSLDIGLQLGIPLLEDGNVHLAIRAFASTRWQEHTVDGRPVLETPVLDLGTGVGFIVELN